MFDNFCRYATCQRVGWHILGDYRPCCNDGMMANRYARQYDGIGTNPHIVANDYGFGSDALLIDA